MAGKKILVDRLTIINAIVAIDTELLRCAGLPDDDPAVARLRLLRKELHAALAVEYVHRGEAEQVELGELAADEATVRIRAPLPPRNLLVREDQDLSTVKDSLTVEKPGMPALGLALALAFWLLSAIALGVVLWLL